MATWEGVQLAPSHYPGRDRVLALAAVLKMAYGKEYILAGRVKYTTLPLAEQAAKYQWFKRFYDNTVMKGLP